MNSYWMSWLILKVNETVWDGKSDKYFLRKTVYCEYSSERSAPCEASYQYQEYTILWRNKEKCQ